MTDSELEDVLIEAAAKYFSKFKTTGEDVSFDDLLAVVKIDVPVDRFQRVFEDVVFWMKEQGFVKYSEAYSGTEGEVVFSRCRLTDSGFERFSRFVDPEGARQFISAQPSVFMQNVNFTNSNFQSAGSHSSLSLSQTIDQSQFSQTLNQIEEALAKLPIADAERADAKSYLGTLRNYAGKALDATGKLVATALSAILTAAGSGLGKSLLVTCGVPAV